MYPTNKSPKISYKFNCSFCNYKCCKLSEYNKHLLTAKHKILQNPTQVNNAQIYTCICGKIYKHSSTLYAHKKKNNCQEIILPSTNVMDDKLTINTNDSCQQLVDYFMKENCEFKQLMLEQNKHMLELAKNSGNHNSHNTTNNSFNLNVFLNETCKDAMNIMDFVGQLQVGIKDLEETGRLGYAEGISKIFINGLKQINISDRPLHCSDSKRETIYIRDKNQWSKENEEKSLLTNAIKHVAHKNMKQISEWTKINPEYKDSSSKQNDRYLKIVCESMCGSTKEETEKNYNKIIKNITKETVIDK